MFRIKFWNILITKSSQNANIDVQMQLSTESH